jgi:hypothetical protein
LRKNDINIRGININGGLGGEESERNDFLIRSSHFYPKPGANLAQREKSEFESEV